jgi:hypothetical protein
LIILWSLPVVAVVVKQVAEVVRGGLELALL